MHRNSPLSLLPLPEEQQRRAAAGSAEDRAALASNPHLSREVWFELFADRPADDDLSARLCSRELDAEQLRWVVASGERRARPLQKLLSHNDVPRDLLEQVADARVASVVAATLIASGRLPEELADRVADRLTLVDSVSLALSDPPLLSSRQVRTVASKQHARRMPKPADQADHPFVHRQRWLLYKVPVAAFAAIAWRHGVADCLLLSANPAVAAGALLSGCGSASDRAAAAARPDVAQRCVLGGPSTSKAMPVLGGPYEVVSHDEHRELLGARGRVHRGSPHDRTRDPEPDAERPSSAQPLDTLTDPQAIDVAVRRLQRTRSSDGLYACQLAANPNLDGGQRVRVARMLRAGPSSEFAEAAGLLSSAMASLREGASDHRARVVLSDPAADMPVARLLARPPQTSDACAGAAFLANAADDAGAWDELLALLRSDNMAGSTLADVADLLYAM